MSSDTRPPGDQPSQEDQAVLRNSALMASGTILSRITGVLRDTMVAAAIGSFLLADAYALGNSLPNIIYILIVGGALNAVFIPQLIRRMRSDADGGDGYADRLLTATAVILLGLSIVAMLSAPWIVRLYSSAELSDSDVELATAFARFCLPQIFFYGIYTMFAQVLNSRLRFGAPMFAPIINNLVMIIVAVSFIVVVGTSVTSGTITDTQVAWLGIGTTVGVVAQALVLVPFLLRAGYRWRLRFDWRGHGLGKAGTMAGWTIGLVLVNQLGFLIIARLATEANAIAAASDSVVGGLATYQRAFLVFMMPQSVITISLVTALLPRMSAAAANGKIGRVAGYVAEGTRTIAVFIIPAVAGLILFGPMIGNLLFGYGQNVGEPATYTGVVVAVFALGLLPFSIFYMLLRGWYSLEDTRTPFFMTVVYNLVAIPLTIALFAIAPNNLKVAALALAYGLAYWVTTALAWFVLRRRVGRRLEGRATMWAGFRLLAAAAIAFVASAAAILVPASFALDMDLAESYTWLVENHLWSVVAMLGGGIVFAVVYFAIAYTLRVAEVRSIVTTLRARLPIGR